MNGLCELIEMLLIITSVTGKRDLQNEHYLCRLQYTP